MSISHFVFSTFLAKMPSWGPVYLANQEKLNFEGSVASCQKF
jgi:hypothetical protein